MLSTRIPSFILPSVAIPQVQIGLASDRVEELQRFFQRGRQGARRMGPASSADPRDQHGKVHITNYSGLLRH